MNQVHGLLRGLSLPLDCLLSCLRFSALALLLESLDLPLDHPVLSSVLCVVQPTDEPNRREKEAPTKRQLVYNIQRRRANGHKETKVEEVPQEDCKRTMT